MISKLGPHDQKLSSLERCPYSRGVLYSTVYMYVYVQLHNIKSDSRSFLSHSQSIGQVPTPHTIEDERPQWLPFYSLQYTYM